MKKRLTTKAIRQYLINNNIPLNQQINFKLSLLQDLLNDLRQCNDNIKHNGIITNNNNNKTIGLNPSVKYKVQCVKLILKLLQEIGIKSAKVDDYDDTEDFINSLIT